MRLVSVNVGLPREVEWEGRLIKTAIWKRPVQGRVHAGRLNLAGDGQADLAGHGGEQRAVMVYQLDSYRYWQHVLQRSDFTYGQFGENFTVEGLDDAEVYIGDRYRIGTAVFEVTQPRVTCFKLGLRMGHPPMPALMVSHRRPGFYFRVIEEGDVAAGDPIERISEGPERMSVAEVDGLLYLADHPVEALTRALQIPALSAGWQASMRALLEAERQGHHRGNAGLTGDAGAVPAWPGFRSLEVATVRQESEDVRSLELHASERTPLPPGLPGQHLVLRLKLPRPSDPITRTYSLCGPPTSDAYRIAVKRENGLGSTFLDQSVRVGDRIESSAPRGSFVLSGGTTPVVFLSAGIGITPLLAMLYAAVRGASATPREIWWVHSARDGAHRVFAGETAVLLKSLPGARCCIIYSHPLPSDRRGVDFDIEGHLNLAVLQRLQVPPAAEFYLCGPPRYLEDLQSSLASLGVPPERVRSEVFGSLVALAPGIIPSDREIPHLPRGPAGRGPRVVFTRSHLTVGWDERFESLLELAEACAVPTRWSCRAGVCHTCESGLIDGSVRYSPQPLDAPADGHVLICCARPESDLELDL
jgi:MOSC domain-containing protein YiiM/ferredoxin-NADP reductase/ferredoxin